ncbi:hypothetical protein DRJ25_02530 [Candidatus Woesearchaeota archaeon]|nr:MAG: hypothetical protein DRJ25_02530 [Candidatus Woesearchaeota archaeon]
MVIGYAIYDKDVKAKDKYKITKLPPFQFKTRAKAKKYAKKMGIKNYKILKVVGLKIPFKD